MYHAPPVVIAERMVRFIFNDGIAPTPNNQCTESDFEYIDPLFNITTLLERRRRHRDLIQSSLQKEASHPMVQDDSYGGRALGNYPARCKDNCAGLVPGTCPASGCLGYRRHLSLLGGLLVGNGSEKILSCEEQLALIHDEIDALIESNVLSFPCQTFTLKSKRKSECFDDVIYGEIHSFTFFTASTTSTTTNRWPHHHPSPPTHTVANLQENAANGYSICASTPFNIELVLNPCVKVVDFVLTNKKNRYTVFSRTDSVHPMTLFDASTGTPGYFVRSPLPLGVRRLPPGSYSLKVKPDNFTNKEKILDFNVIAC
jgi:hypothetical protein